MNTYCLSLKPPWSHLLIHGLPDRYHAVHRKDVENRSWRPIQSIVLPFRLVIHASAKQDPNEYMVAINICHQQCLVTRSLMCGEHPTPLAGGIIGVVECWRIDQPGDDDLTSPWRVPDQYGWRVRNPRPLPFYQCRGTLGLWPPTREILSLIEQSEPFDPVALIQEDVGQTLPQLPGWAENV